MPTQQPLIKMVADFFAQENWPVTPLEGEPALLVKFQGENGRWDCVAYAREELGQFAFYSIAPVTAPPARRQAVAEFVIRANFGLVPGNWELDLDGGEIRFKTSLVLDPSLCTPQLIDPVVYGNVLVVDHYLPGLMAVIYGGVSPADAVATAEAGQSEPGGE